MAKQTGPLLTQNDIDVLGEGVGVDRYESPWGRPPERLMNPHRDFPDTLGTPVEIRPVGSLNDELRKMGVTPIVPGSFGEIYDHFSSGLSAIFGSVGSAFDATGEFVKTGADRVGEVVEDIETNLKSVGFIAVGVAVFVLMNRK